MASRVRFGIFDFDPDTRELRREGARVRLQAQPAQVLAVLVEHAGELVTREQLRSAVWGSETFVDFDRGLNFCVAQIRAALGDSAESPRFVRTIPKQGYQFVAPVGLVEIAMAAPAAVVRSPKKYVWVAGFVVLACSLAALTLALPRRTLSNIAVARFDNETGDAAMDRFTDGLADVVIAELTARSPARFGIIGNAAILQLPRKQRDLAVIGSTLMAGYVVIGQVQQNASHIRVLAHLIRLPEQTHVDVVKIDREIKDPLEEEKQMGKQIATEFARRLDASQLAVKP